MTPSSDDEGTGAQAQGAPLGAAVDPAVDPAVDSVPEAVPQPRDAGNWSAPVTRLQVDDTRAAAGYNLSGRRLTGPQQGFGKLWQRTYTCPIGTVATPQEAIAAWKTGFGTFWPKTGRFFGSEVGISPGEVAPIAMTAGPGVKLATGVLVLYADEESFTFMTPQGHMFAGWITFSAHDRDDGTALQIQVLARPNDPIYELGMPLMRRMEDTFWKQTLLNVASRLGSLEAQVFESSVIVDKHRLWRNARNVWHNAGVRSVLHILTTPLRAVRGAGRRTSR
jgi:hypothetical protein